MVCFVVYERPFTAGILEAPSIRSVPFGERAAFWMIGVPVVSSACSVISPSLLRRKDEEDEVIEPAPVPSMADVPSAASLNSVDSVKEKMVS